MNRCNEGITEADILQNHFTAYLQTSLKRCKTQYMKKQNARMVHEVELKPNHEDTEEVFCISIAENAALSAAMKQIRTRDRIVITLRAVEGRSFQEIAVQLGMKYSSVTMVYYRALDKLRIILQADEC